MRVLHWCPNFLGGGAVANTVVGLAEAQALLGADTFIVAAETAHRPLYGSLEVTRTRVLTWRPAWTVHRWGVGMHGIASDDRSRLRAVAPDVVHIHSEFNPDNFWVPRIFSCPIVLTVQGALHPTVLVKTRHRGKIAYLHVARRLLYRHVTFHALSPLEVGQIAAAVPGAHIYCLPQGPGPQVGTLPASNGRVAARSPLEFITVSRLDVFTKGLDLLLDAYARASRVRDVATSLTLVGPDWRNGRATLERQARALKIEQEVRFTGTVAPTDVGALLRQASVYVQASRHEGLSLSITEALVAGKPVIMTNANGAGAFDEVASLPHVRIVAPDPAELAEAMIHFIENIEDLTVSGLRAQRGLSEFFSWQRVAQAHLGRYRELKRR